MAKKKLRTVNFTATKKDPQPVKVNFNPTVTEQAAGVGQKDVNLSSSPIPQAAAPSPAEQLNKLLEAITDHMEAQDKALETLSKRLDTRTSAIAAKIDDKPEPQPHKMDPLEIFGKITDFMNTPLIQKLSDKLLGGLEPAATEAPPLNEEYIKYLETRRNKQDILFDDYQTAIIDGLKLSNKLKAKEFESDF